VSLPKTNWADLTKEKCLWDVYLQARKIKSSITNVLITLGMAVFLGFASWCSPIATERIQEQLSSWGEFGASSALGILGFLIAGFTIFATTKQDMLLAMHRHIHKETGLTYLEYNIYSFIKVFIFHLAFGAFCFGLVLLFAEDSPFFHATGSLVDSATKRGLLKVLSVTYGVGLTYLLVTLKSFVFNIHHVVMSGLRWAGQEEDSNQLED
jgi:hypothetical protein